MPIKQKNALTGDQAEELFATVDETGHSNEETAERQRKRRSLFGHGVDVDPLSGEDPSGNTVEKSITHAAIAVIVIFLVVIVLAQVSCGVARRMNTADLSANVNVRTVATALRGGVEWGNGFTQFPEDFTVQEADEKTGRVEVTVVDTSSRNTLECFAGSQVQATAFAVNALLNQNINTVVYHVQVYHDDQGNIMRSALFGFLKPSGNLDSFMTFIWTKTTSANGRVNFTCRIAGMDENVQDTLRSEITTWSPTSILGLNNSDTQAETRAEETGTESSASTSADTSSQDASTSTDAAASK